MIIPVYKPLGTSTHQLAQRVGEQLGEKATHTGTLDPLAEGVVIVLTGQDRFRKAELSNGHKTYQFAVLFGVSTDSHDLLGLPTAVCQTAPELAVIERQFPAVLTTLKNAPTQVTPAFSAKRFQGASFFDHAKAGKQTELPPTSQDIAIFELRATTFAAEKIATLQTNTAHKIAVVEGDFRQKEVLSAWEHTWKTLAERGITQLPLVTCQATTSKRVYIRGLVRDSSAEMNLPATTAQIIRTQNGPFGIADCDARFSTLA